MESMGVFSGGDFRAWTTLLVLVSLLLGVSGIAAAKDESALVEVAIQLKWRHQFQFAGYYAAIEQGYYRDAGLNVTLYERSESRSPIDQLMSGRVEFAVADTGALIYRASGVPLVALAAIFQSSPSVLVTRADGPIDSLYDLKNQPVMLSGGYMNAELLAMLANAGMAVDDVQVVPSETSLEPLISGEVAGYNGYSTNEPFEFTRRAIPYRVFRPSDYGIDFYGDILLTTETMLNTAPDVTRNFLEATRRGWDYALTHPDKVVDLILRDYNTLGKSREHLMFEAEASKSLILPNVVPVGYMNEERWRHIESVFRDQGLLTGEVDLNTFLYSAEPDSLFDELFWAHRWYWLVALVSMVGLALLLHARRLHAEVAVRTRQLSDAKQQAEQEARTDYLTNLPNRRHLLECLVRYSAQSQRHDLPLSLIMIDVDYFKRVNDEYGHAAGDEALRQVSALLAESVRTGDMAARMGGEEFAIVCLNNDAQEAVALAQRLCQDIASTPVTFGSTEFSLTVSMGIAVYEHGEAVSSLLQKADLALYQAKAGGRNRVQTWHADGDLPSGPRTASP
ncbi:diguanylate cyclase (GGDEF)-like protein [Marinimicrobium koreense]|uniref:diguanylate cyclase n=1 Tax=Marinimicrobium koreense TaxID=306545 RepID=A0A3N1NSW8_9GAMM|nr:diguanylate cyclase (GGDEF)-like protein [Marinimicrobium koreense]